MQTDKTRLGKVLCIIAAFITFSFSVFTPQNAYAEGSVDFIDSPGFRLFYFAERPQQLKVYADAGEFINFGASHVGISSGFIEVYRPDGTLHSRYNNTGSSAGLGIINNNIEELNGPTGGGSTQGAGYTPGIVEVEDGEQGVWTITLGYSFYQNSGFPNLLNNEPWTRDVDQPTNRRVVLAWDITVSQNQAANEGGQLQTGRVYTNEYQSIVSENGNTTSPSFYILTERGFQFRIDYQDVDPWGFQIVSNNKGIISGDNAATYSSFDQNEVVRSADISSFDPALFYQYEPQARDMSGIVNNKVFFNLPDPNLPISATVTDIVRGDTHTTWLLNEVPTFDLEILDIELISNDPVNNQGVSAVLDRTNGALVTYTTNVDGTVQLIVDINGNGIYGDENDRVVNGVASVGTNQVLWDGLDNNGASLDQQFNREFSYQLRLNVGELHLSLADIENDLGGVKLTRINGESPNSEFLYDHSRLGGAISGNNTLPLPTEETFTFANNFGDLKILDYWTYESSVTTVSDLIIDIVDDISLLAPDSDGDGVRDDSDLDDDNDGILDELEICGDQEASCFSNNFNPDYDEDFDGIPNYADADDPAFDLGCIDADGDGRCDNLLPEFDKDQDGVPNSIDLDADNDGIYDVTETLLADVDNDGFLFEGTPIVDAFGRVLEDNTSTANYITNTANNDDDVVPNFLDIDSDNDGIHDILEGGNEDPEGDGVLLTSGTKNVNILGVVVAVPNQNVSSLPSNMDGDLLPDYLDLDSDNDGINDVIEGGNLDADNDGRADGDANEFGQLINAFGDILSTSFPTDRDADGIPNFRDLDSDNDGINDVIEGGNDDPDNDGLVGTGVPNVAPDGRVVSADGSLISTSFPLDTDQDGSYDYEDLDSDNDGIFDVYEANLSDNDNDGQIGEGDLEVDGNGIVILDGNTNNTSNPIDTDDDGIPDFRDLDSDNDTLSDNQECPDGAPCPDVDGSGVPDYVQLTPVACPVPLVTPTVDTPSDICANEMLTLTVNESSTYEAAYPTETITYIWTNNNGVEIASTTNPDFTIMGDDSNLVLPLSVMVSVDVDCMSESSAPVSPTINPVPVPNASADFENICVGESVQLMADDIPGATYQWFLSTFPFSSQQNPNIASLNVSTTFGLVATLNGCQNEVDEVTVTADAPAEIEVTFGAGSYCAGSDVTINAINNNSNLSGNLNYVLTGPDGLMVSVNVPADGTFEYTLTAVDMVNAGDYSLVVESSQNCVSNTESITVDVTDGVEQPVIAVSDNSVCPTEDFTLTTQTYTGPNVVYTWLLNGVEVGTSSIPEFTINNAATIDAGNYAIRVDIGSGCGPSTSAPVAISIVDTSVSPVIEDDLNGTTACEGQTITLRIANPTPETIYTWFDPSGQSIANNFTEIGLLNVQMSDQGLYRVEANIDGCVTLTDDIMVEVAEGLETPEVADLNLSACAGQSIDFVISNFTSEPNTTFNWFLDNGAMVAQTSVPSLTLENLTTASNGTYFVVAEQGQCVSMQSVEFNLTVNDVPNEMADAGIDASYCASEIVNLNANTPSVGEGSWISTTGNIIDANNPNTEVTNLSLGANEFVWVLNANGCEDYSRDTVVINVTDVPSEVASIQNTQTNFCETSVSSLALSAVTANESTGQWATVNGPSNLVFDDVNNEATNVSGFVPGTYNISWTLSTQDCGVFSTDEISITIDEQPSDIANAGFDQTICNGAPISVSANTPSLGMGQWTSNTGVVFLDVNDPNTEISGLALGENTLVWTLSNGACVDYSFDQVVIETTTSPDEQATVITQNINVCEGSNLSLEAIAPVLSTGAWVQSDGPSATIMNPNQTATNINYSQAGIYTFTWQLSEASCGVFSTANVEVVIDELPNELANAGIDNVVCGTEVNLSALTPSVGGGVWTSTSGTITDPSDPNTLVTNLDAGEHTFTWTLSSGACQDYATDQVTITTNTVPDEIAEVVNSNVNICENNMNGILNLVAIDPLMSSGQWAQVSGPNNATITNEDQAIAEISNLMPGVYQFSWTLSMGDCIAFSNDIMTVTVDELPTGEVANAGVDQSICLNSNITLNAEMPSIGTGSWSIFNTVGASVNDIMDPNTEAQLVEGENIFVWSLSNGGCENYQRDTVRIFLSTPDDNAEIITEAVELCESDVTTIALQASALTTATGAWTQTAGPNTANIDNDNSELVNIDNLVAGTYTFQWTLSESTCMDYDSDQVTVNITAVPDDLATVSQDELVVCDANEVNLNAINPTIANGVWTNDNSAVIVDPNQSNTIVNNLQTGVNTFVWTLSAGNCVDYSQAELNVFVEDGVSVAADNFNTDFEVLIENESLISNDNFNGNTDWTIELVGNVPEVSINNDGTFSFSPSDGFSGDFTFEYDLCDMSCGTCERAQVTISVAEPVSVECDVPNVLTPNNDNKNDALIIDCTNQFENNVIQIFNRWGDKVYEEETYTNNWRGTFNGDDLPAGTYFYVFKKDRNESETMTGYITIIR